MEHIRKRPAFMLGITSLVLGMFAVTRLATGPRGPTCVELPAAQPGFAALSRATQPACIRHPPALIELAAWVTRG